MSEQLLVLWTLLLEGYVPVAHMVADLDAPEIVTSNEPAPVRGAYELRRRAQLSCKVAA